MHIEKIKQMEATSVDIEDSRHNYKERDTIYRAHIFFLQYKDRLNNIYANSMDVFSGFYIFTLKRLPDKL